MSDSLANGRAIRLLTVVDTFTRESLAIEGATSLPGTRVVAVLERLATAHGVPGETVLDNGSELTGTAMDQWASGRGVQRRLIAPGKPVQNAFTESEGGRLRDEGLNEHWFITLADARGIVAAWRHNYNHARPHSALGYSAPAAFAASGKPPEISPPRAEALLSSVDQRMGAGHCGAIFTHRHHPPHAWRVVPHAPSPPTKPPPQTTPIVSISYNYDICHHENAGLVTANPCDPHAAATTCSPITVATRMTIRGHTQPRRTVAQGAQTIADFLALRLPTVDDDELVGAAYEVAQQDGCAFYDG